MLMNTDDRRRRRHRRVTFVYPVEFRILLPDFENRSFSGLFSLISLSGALFQFQDKYGRIEPAKVINSRVKLKIALPQREQIFLFARIRSTRRVDLKHGLSFMFGVEFEELADWQLEIIEGIISLRNRDQKMMWNLWDDYAGQGKRQGEYGR